MFMQKAWWMGTKESSSVVSRFKIRHGVVAAEHGFSAARIAAEQKLFDSAFVWTSSDSNHSILAFDPVSIYVGNAVRLGITSLPIGIVKLLINLANQLNALPHVSYEHMDPTAVRNILDQLPAGEAVPEVLQFVLNTPSRCDAFLYLEAENQCLALSTTFDPDEEKLIRPQVSLRAGARGSAPTVRGRSVCFTCGTSSLTRGVALKMCAGCKDVAYCSPLCQRVDWKGEHFRECKLTAPVTTDEGLLILPPSALCITRVLTEAEKPRSLKIRAGTGGGVVLIRFVVRAKDGSMMLVNGGWQCQAVDEPLGAPGRQPPS